ncbi:MAG: ATP-binding protein [Cyanobacteriota bacterium]|nr:ATP-binding protein [Cyanobacteriota bacterium]
MDTPRPTVPTRRQASNRIIDLQSSLFAPVRKLFHGFKVSQKISLGYVVVLGIAVSGTSAGILLGDRHQQMARAKMEDVLEETRLLAALDQELSHALLHQHRIIIFGREPKRFQEEYVEFRAHAMGFNRVWQEFRKSYVPQDRYDRTDELVLIEELLTRYDGLTSGYLNEVEFIAGDLDPDNWQLDEFDEDRGRLIRLNQNRLGLGVRGLSEELEQVSIIVAKEAEEAERYLHNAKILQIRTIAASMILSVAIAIVFSIRTSRAISAPLRKVTHIAHKVTTEDNFDLQVSVTSQDEAGILALAIDRLIVRVRQLLQEQQQANETLENRVRERTQELHDKNKSLQETLRQLQRTQAQLIQAEKMSSLGQMVAGVAHEINNPVNFIYGNLTHAREYMEDVLGLLHLYQEEHPNPTPAIAEETEAIELDFIEEDLMKLFQSMRVGADRIQEIVKSLRNFSRLDEAEIKTVDVHEGLGGTLMILQNRLKAKPEYPAIEVMQNYGELPAIDCYPGQLNQVFMNLLANAIDALEEKRLRGTDKATIEIHTEVLSNQTIGIRIRDNGSGIPNSIRSKLFDPFFTTKPVGKGTGLGLSISYQIVVDKHGGTLRCHSTPGEGTEFAIELPIRQGAIEAA